MNMLNFTVGIKNPASSFERANWYQARVNIIYIPFSFTKIQDWYVSDPQIKQFYKTIIVPDKVTIGSIPARKVQNYIAELKKTVKGIKVEKIVKNSINKPVIVDLTPVAYTFWQLVNSRGVKYAAPDFFNLVHSIYNMLTSAKQTGASETVVVFDFTNEYTELEKLLLFLKLNEYQIPTQIADRYVLFHYKKNYLALTIDSNMEINKIVFSKLYKISKEKVDEKIEEKIKNDSDVQDAESLKADEITIDLIKKVLRSKFNKNIDDDLELESIVKITQRFISQHPDVNINLGDQSEVANLIKETLKNEIKLSGKPISFDELLAEHRKQFVFKKDVDVDKIHSSKTLGINTLKATNIKWVTDPQRTKIEFDENLDRNIEKLIESLDDPSFKMHVLGVEKEIQDDGRSRYYIYKIKIKPEKGRAYITKLRVPALVHGTYLKIGGNFYAINNQLMQLPIIKKAANTVQLKTNYSVTDYSIKSFPQTVKDFKDIVDKFLNIMKVTKKLKTAEVMDSTTEARLRDFGVPVDEIAKINYKKIEIKD